MNNHEYNLYKILSGKTKLKINDRDIEVLPPSYEILFKAAELYNHIYNHGYCLGALSKGEMIEYMMNRGLWTHDDEAELEKLADRISDAKADLYNSYVRFENLDNRRKIIIDLENRQHELYSKLQVFDRFTVDGIAHYHKVCFLLCSSANLNYYNPEVNLNKFYMEYMNTVVGDYDIRQIAKSDEWRQYWRGIKLGYKIFGDVLTREQHQLISWSQFYDNIYESPDCPDESAIEDDDLLDGWCVVQRRKRKEEDKKRAADRFGNAGEIFIPAQNPEQAHKINELNDQAAQRIKKQREMVIQKHGSVKEQDMPDSKAEIRQKAVEDFKSKMRG